MNCSQLLEMNAVARLLRRSGYRCADRGTRVVVEDPVYSSGEGGALRRTGSNPVVLRSLADAWRFLIERS